MTINLHSLFQGSDPRVLEVFWKLMKKIVVEDKTITYGGSKADKVYDRIVQYTSEGKKLQRAMADALADFKLGGAVP